MTFKSSVRLRLSALKNCNSTQIACESSLYKILTILYYYYLFSNNNLNHCQSEIANKITDITKINLVKFVGVWINTTTLNSNFISNFTLAMV